MTKKHAPTPEPDAPEYGLKEACPPDDCPQEDNPGLPAGEWEELPDGRWRTVYAFQYRNDNEQWVHVHGDSRFTLAEAVEVEKRRPRG